MVFSTSLLSSSVAGMLVMVTLFASSSMCDASAKLAAQPAAINLDYVSNKQASTKLDVGDEFTVNLESNPTTGYSWQLVSSSEYIEKVDNKYVATSSQPGLVGGGGTDVWTFKGKAPGSGELVFAYKRPWETDSFTQAKVAFVVS
eukprot:CAMPEP_0113680918 /NCGR_PEP_ID=MMETSP0038_2-20120614/11640_1 /TAXON_ID=2898 /ORGANISM="Cryptomonas paramecium" /LENGTH=144 /DNA_ID=CAMNT_0000599461 /DNA_START=13 /DNA_END=447 /DNA_ORIENTATION=- /assembly_acc=CAM_ASM_000170